MNEDMDQRYEAALERVARIGADKLFRTATEQGKAKGVGAPAPEFRYTILAATWENLRSAPREFVLQFETQTDEQIAAHFTLHLERCDRHPDPSIKGASCLH